MQSYVMSEFLNEYDRNIDSHLKSYYSSHDIQKTKTPGQTKKSLDQLKWLHDGHKCFKCEQTKHIVKDCLKQHRLPFELQSKVPALQAHSVSVTNADIVSAAMK